MFSGFRRGPTRLGRLDSLTRGCQCGQRSSVKSQCQDVKRQFARSISNTEDHSASDCVEGGVRAGPRQGSCDSPIEIVLPGEVRRRGAGGLGVERRLITVLETTGTSPPITHYRRPRPCSSFTVVTSSRVRELPRAQLRSAQVSSGQLRSAQPSRIGESRQCGSHVWTAASTRRVLATSLFGDSRPSAHTRPAPPVDQSYQGAEAVGVRSSLL